MRVALLILSLVTSVSVLAQGTACDARSAARSLFMDQGLHVLTPARSYIEVGGLVVVPRGGSPYYVDRLAQLPTGSDEPALDFAAILLKETRGRNATLGVSVPAVQSIIPIPFNVKYDAMQSVELAQVDASGTRLKLPTALSFIHLPAPNKWITTELANKARTFIVYEVYRAKSLTLKAANNAALDVGLKVGESTPAVVKPAPESQSAGGAQPAPAAKPAAGDPKATTKPADKPANEKVETDGVGGKWTRSSNYELSLQSDTSVPFAVRLSEVVNGKNGLELRPGSFKFKGGLASGTDVEQMTAIISPKTAELTVVRRRTN